MSDRDEPSVALHGQEWRLSDLREAVDSCLQQTWRHQRWEVSDALFDSDGRVGTRYHGQEIAEGMKVIPGGWDHDHCEICWATLCDQDDDDEHAGWTDGEGSWVCDECYQKLLAPVLRQGDD
ncbi:MAG: hypothetical protein ACYTFO_03445 [Planctomycetota bacterium]|jgi:hypothetical protein